jgi:tagatose-1,6-bisphosphate aldolase
MKMTLEQAESKKIIVWWDPEYFNIDPQNLDLIEWINQGLYCEDLEWQVRVLVSEYGQMEKRMKEYKENTNANKQK